LKQPKIYNTALYMRLSRDDESYGDSVSIETQRTILRKYAADNGLHVVDEYVDDGWSGTNFERPSFKRMVDDVDAGKVNCIVTKDLSRFGRDHVMMDYYLEFVFPEKQIRYIAVTENEDTERGLRTYLMSGLRKTQAARLRPRCTPSLLTVSEFSLMLRSGTSVTRIRKMPSSLTRTPSGSWKRFSTWRFTAQEPRA